jgi:hypothetical protein
MTRKKVSENSKALQDRVNSAVKGGRYLAAIVEFDPNEEATFNYFYVQESFPDTEVFNSLQKIATMYKEQKMKVAGGEKIG